MGELLAVTCDSRGAPMVPNVSTLDADGCLWICLSPGCPELAVRRLRISWTRVCVASVSERKVRHGREELAGRLARLVDHYVEAEEARAREADAPARRAGRAQADLARVSTRTCSSSDASPKAQAPSPAI